MKFSHAILSIISFIIFNIFLADCNADMYKWKDAEGVLHFSDVQPGQNKSFEKVEGSDDSIPKQPHQNNQTYDTELPSLENFSIKNARAVCNYHDKNSKECSSIEFFSLITNNSDIDRTIYISFHIRNDDGIVLEKDNGFKDIEAKTGDMEPRVLVAFNEWDNYSCKDVASIDFYYYEKDAERNKITLPIVDANHR